jgi:hypothetical protein
VTAALYPKTVKVPTLVVLVGASLQLLGTVAVAVAT